uniref:Uncharacterized protein n=1 Tax=Anopheles melas TaxID=34690 RepID=A0A182UHB1_9DIPT
MNSVHSELFYYFPHTHISNVLNVLPRKQHKQSEQKGRPWAVQELGGSGLRAFSIDDNPPYSGVWWWYVRFIFTIITNTIIIIGGEDYDLEIHLVFPCTQRLLQSHLKG